MRSITLLFLIITVATSAQKLTRRAQWQASLNKVDGAPGAILKSIEKDSPLDKSGLMIGDILLSVDGRLITIPEDITSVTYAIRANTPTELLVRRGADVFNKSVTLNALPLEEHEGLQTNYTEIISDYGLSHRAIITKPENSQGKLPAIFFVQGLSCSTLETYTDRSHNWARMIRTVVEQSGMVVMRVDKPGVGDSEGDCASGDFEMDLAGYKAGIRKLKSLDYVDTTKIILYGSSMGSAQAPMLANEFNLAGVISDGTFFKTWFEHMLEIERRLQEMQGVDESTIIKKMNEGYIPLYYNMLILKKSYGEIIDEYPALAEYNYHSPNHMYGRPMEYYHQLQDYDLAGEWERLKAPVRILRGTNDWIMSDFDNDMIIEVLEKAGHKDHELVRYKDLDHWNTIHESPDNSFFGKPGTWDPKMAELVVNWAREMAGMKPIKLK
ncbi:alpha/beta fold hydrolase [Fulvivirga lutea]|uniref:Alpha/beta hydrolase n=1 Tax=Fulvivirga lutea TaxID=2810512 RepID=A0A974WL48_9BACT|nr:alpha/beta fold hydrolase [Fulvivirga lutea]QSE99227.1 alpha/beta hydrolase [Fulvivirga lutea]